MKGRTKFRVVLSGRGDWLRVVVNRREKWLRVEVSGRGN